MTTDKTPIEALNEIKISKSDLKKEFFEAFKYEPEYRILMGRRKIDNIPVYEYFKTLADAEQFLLDEFEEGLGAKNIEEVYPPITPEIVLELEEIILLISDNYNFSVEHFNNEARFLFCDKRIILENKSNLKDCILSSCIQLKDEIQEGVRGLFINNKQNGVIDKLKD